MNEQNRKPQGKTVYDYMTFFQTDFDIHDNEVDNCVTVSYEEDWEDEKASSYTKFVKSIISKVEVESKISEYQLLAKWSEFIRKNKTLLWEFSEKHWKRMYSDERMVEEWISEIHSYFAGGVWEEFYDELLELGTRLK